MAIGTISCFLLSALWDTQVDIAGNRHSIVFLTLTTTLAIVDCTSSVLYFPFLSHFKPTYLRSLIIGEGFSGLIPSLASLVQGVSGNPSCVNQTIELGNGTIIYKLKPVYREPRYSVSTFFVFLGLLMIASWIAFILINRLDSIKKERVDDKKQVSDRTSRKEAEDESDGDSLLSFTEISKPCFFTFLLIQAYVCCLMNGVLAAISTYSTLPYGNLTYHLSTNLSIIAGPTAAFLVFALHKTNFQKPVLPLTIFGSIAAGYIISVAASSPHPPLQDGQAGAVLIVMAWVAFHGSFSYVKACIAGTMRNCSFGGHKALFYYGLFTQIGSFVGAFVIFFVVNFTHSFKSFKPCQ